VLDECVCLYVLRERARVYAPVRGSGVHVSMLAAPVSGCLCVCVMACVIPCHIKPHTAG